MRDTLEKTLFVGLIETFVDAMNGLTLGFRHEREQSTAQETCITAKLDSGDAIWFWYRPDDPTRIQMTSVPFGSDYSRFGITVNGDKVHVGFFGRGTQLMAASVPTVLSLLSRWRELAIAAQGQALIVFPTR
ncbi:hypothetical protein GOB57_10185 [Sinorhizobium meliloti]|nr:hypothetical protein [Sinorhizobium meliloti]